jgi:hypothetical protein
MYDLYACERVCVCYQSELLNIDGFYHGLVNYIDTKAKFRHLKKSKKEGLCGRCLSEFIDW